MNLIVWLLGRGDPARGRALLDDVADLFRERRLARGWRRAALGAAWDLVTLIVRPPRPRPADRRRGWHARFLLDLRQAGRGLGRRPAVPAAAFVTLTLGFALSGLTFVVIRGVLFDPLPFPDGDSLVSVATEFRAESGYELAFSALSWPETLDYGAESDAVDVAGYLPVAVNLAPPGEDPERIAAARASSRLFDVLGVSPAIGQPLGPRHDAVGGPCGVVLSAGLWRERFGGDPAIAGRTVVVDGLPCEVTGVMPAGFEFPDERTRAWVPFPADRDPDRRGDHGVLAVGRLRTGVTYGAAVEEARTLMASWALRHRHHRGHGIRLMSLRDAAVGDARLPLLVIGAAVVLVLVVMTANVGGLSLASGLARRRELAVRAALGADRAHLARQVGLETFIVTAAAGGAALAIAGLFTPAIVTASPGLLPRVSAITFDPHAAAVMTVLAVVVGALMASITAWHLTGPHLTGVLTSGERASTLPARGVFQALVTAELTLAIAVTPAALLLVQSFVRLSAVPLGFEPHGVAYATVSLDEGVAGAGEARASAFYGELRARLLAWPGVEGAGVISAVPLAQRPPPDLFFIDGRPVPAPGEPGPIAHYVMAGPGALEALGVRRLRGRSVTDDDTATSAPVAVVNETAARQYWPGEEVVGRRIRYPTGLEDGRWSSWTPWITIVGVVADVRSLSPAIPAEPAIYASYAQRPRAAYAGTSMRVVLKFSGAMPSPADVRAMARAVDPAAVVTPPALLSAQLGAALARPRFVGTLLSGFAAITGAVALIGVYAIVAFRAASRRREFGVRLALGATRSRIFRLVARQSAWAIAIALPAGLAGAWGLARWMSSLLYGVAPFHPWTYAGVAAAFVCAAGVAALGPARRAMRVDPLTSMRPD